MGYGTRLFALAWMWLLFSAGRVEGASVLNFPRISFDSDIITGVAIANPGAAAAQVTLTLYGADGGLLQAPGLVNPRQITVAAGRQYAEVTAAIFGSSVPPSTLAWLQARSDAEDLTGFFLVLDRSVSYFDGADLPRASRLVVFNEVRLDSGFATELNLVNPSQNAATVSLRLMGGGSPVLRSLQIPARGVARLDAATFFGLASAGGADLSAGTAGAGSTPRYVVAQADGTDIAGFAFARGPGDLLGQNAVPAGNSLTTLYFPQLAVLGVFETQLVVVNTGSETAILTISARRPDGGLYDGSEVRVNPVSMALPAGGALREDLENLFGFSGGASREGWLQVDSSVQSVTGSISYAIPANGSLAAVGSLTQGSRRAVFSHIATTAGFFTGVALLNTSSLAANYRITALRADGSILGTFSSLLRPGERISRLIDDLIPEAAGQAGGLILVQSDVALYLTSLFGSTATGILANIPPQPVPASFDPAAGLPTLAVAPALAILAPSAQQSFNLQGGTGVPVWSVDGTPGGTAASGRINAAGRFTAPAQVPADLPVTVSARTGDSQAGASVDVISERELAGGLGVVRSVVFLEGLRRVYTAEVEGAGALQGTAGGATNSTIYDVTTGARQTVRSFPGQDIVKMLSFTSPASVDFLLLLDRAGGRLTRLNSLNNQTQLLVSGLNQPAAMTFDLTSGDLLVADFNQVIRIPRANVAAEVEGSPAQTDFEIVAAPAGLSNLRGIAFNRCDGSIIVSSGPAPQASGDALAARSGRLFRLDARTGQAEPMGTPPVNEPGQLLALYRRGLSCPEAFQLLVVDEATGGVVLTIPSMDFRSTWVGDANAVDLGFIPATPQGDGLQGGSPLGATAAVAIGGVNRGGEVAVGSASLADIPGLYDAAPVNPPALAAPRADFDAVADFSASRNPAGVWSYGYAEGLGAAFTPFAGPTREFLGNLPIPGAFFWVLDIAGTVADFPVVGGNLSGADIQAGSALVPVNRLFLHPGEAGQYAILRWTAPEAATYQIQGVFQGLDQTTTDVHVLVDNGLLISQVVDAFGRAVNFSFRVSLPRSGIPIDLAVGTGGNGFNFDSTGVQLTINRVN